MLDRQHPVRDLLLSAALGRRTPSAMLDAALDSSHAPDGADLGRLRRLVAIAADEVVTIATCGDPSGRTKNHLAARRRADELTQLLDGQMTDDEREIRSNPARDPDFAEIARRALGDY